MAYQVHLSQVTPQLTAVVRLRAQRNDFPTVIPQACGEVWEFFRVNNLPRPGRHLAVYLDNEVNLEVGVEVQAPFTGNDRVILSSTPGGTVATTAHYGPYNQLGEAHHAVHDWCKQNGHALVRPCWELYGHWEDDPAKLRTDIFYLLRLP